MEFVNNLLPKIVPFLVIGAVAYVGYWIKLILDKNKNVKMAQGCVWVQVIPSASAERNYMVPIEDLNGTQYVRIPNVNGKRDDHSPRYLLASPGKFSAVYPPNKPKFVQLTVDKVVYQEGNAECVSNFTDRPIVSAQAITNMLEGVAANAADVMMKLQNESDGSKPVKKQSQLLWVYVLLGIIGVIGIVNMVLAFQGLSMKDMLDAISKAMGIQ